MIFDAELNALSLCLCSVQVYTQEFEMRTRHLLGDAGHAKANTKGARFF